MATRLAARVNGELLNLVAVDAVRVRGDGGHGGALGLLAAALAAREDARVDGARGEELEHGHGPRLADAVHAHDGLLLRRGVERRLGRGQAPISDDRIGDPTCYRLGAGRTGQRRGCPQQRRQQPSDKRRRAALAPGAQLSCARRPA